jgi:site-specific recombinase XerC
MIEQLLSQFFEHLRYERNVSEHTLRNYASDLLGDGRLAPSHSFAQQAFKRRHFHSAFRLPTSAAPDGNALSG